MSVSFFSFITSFLFDIIIILCYYSIVALFILRSNMEGKMLIITEKDLIMGRVALAVFQQCQHSPDCFLGNIKTECDEERCFLPRIRKDLEEASPDFAG